MPVSERTDSKRADERKENVMKKIFDPAAFDRIFNKGNQCVALYNDCLLNARKLQMDFLAELLRKNQNTEYGAQHGFGHIQSYEEFKASVPITEYNDYFPFIQRMMNDGEKNLLSADPVVYYATSSGTSGTPKYIPVTENGKQKFSSYSGIVPFHHLMKQIRAQGHHAGPVCFIPDYHWKTMQNGVEAGSISAHLSYNYWHDLESIATSPWRLQTLDEPTPDAMYLKALFALQERDVSCIVSIFTSILYEFLHLIELNWEKLVHDIRTGELNKELTLSDKLRQEMTELLKPNPARAEELEKEFTKGFASPIIPRIWSNLSMLCGVGGSFFAGYTRKTRKYSGNVPIYMLGYAASEAFMGLPLDCEDEEYSLLPNDVFYEFRLVDDDETAENTAHRIYLMDELEIGKEYEIIITNTSGFYRYRMLDVFRVEGFTGNVPRGHIVYRLNQMINMVGEKTTTEQIDTIVKQLGNYVGTSFTDYALYPDYSSTPARYILLLESDEYIGKGDQKNLSPMVDKLFRTANTSFDKYRHQNTMGIPLVTYLEPSSFRLFKEIQIASGISANQIKPVRVIDTKKKTQFFFALSEGPYKAMRRVLYDAEQKIEELMQVKEENQRLKKENEELKTALYDYKTIKS